MIGRRAFTALPLLAAANFAYAAEPRSSGPAHGTLLVVGGGAVGPVLIETARRYMADTARWVVIPTAESDRDLAERPVPAFIRGRFPYTVLHTRNRAEADTDAFTAPLRDASVVWIEGGRQWRLAEIYGGTRTEQALHALLARGGLIGGSSAGASIMGSFLVRGAPSGNQVLMALGHERGFGFLQNVAIDQHIVVRHREADLARVVAAHPTILGIGIDEGTAILVRGNVFTVVGPSIVAVTDGATHDGRPYLVLRQGARFDLANWAVPASPA